MMIVSSIIGLFAVAAVIAFIIRRNRSDDYSIGGGSSCCNGVRIVNGGSCCNSDENDKGAVI